MAEQEQKQYHRISVVEDDNAIDIVVPKELAEDFKRMVFRALNTWPDMKPEIRDFSDRLFNKQHIMGRNMKWELPSEEQYELQEFRRMNNGRRATDMIVSSARCPQCLELPCQCSQLIT